MEGVGVALANWNGMKYLGRCLQAVYAQSGGIPEVVVVDNGSTDGSREWIRQHYPEVRLLENEHNRGFAAGYNQAIAAGSQAFVLILNSDVFLAPDFVEQALKGMRQGRDIGAVTGRIFQEATGEWLNGGFFLRRQIRLVPSPNLEEEQEVEAALNRRIPYLSLPETLRDFFLRTRHPLVITGTHGKTTTTALTAHLLAQAGLDPGFMVAGLPRNFPRPYHLGTSRFFVIEGDEYDSAFFAKTAKFFYYLPEILVINNIEFDHADIYDSLAQIEKAFRQLVNLVPANGLLLANHEDPAVARLLPLSFAPVQTFGLEEGAFWQATQIESSSSGQSFVVCQDRQPLGRFHLNLSGRYNIYNALAAIGAGTAAGLSAGQVQAGLSTFTGVRRRQELIGTAAGITLIDDFAHHPTAVQNTLEGLRQTFPQGRLWAVFEPASATNARAIFEEQYLKAFAPADRVILARVPRPERARQDPPFSPQRLAEQLCRQGHSAWYIPEVTAIVDHLAAAVQPGDLVVFMSNSGFGDVQRQLLKALQERRT